ncbi:integral membrane protein PTH11 [Fusarium heterosporum]|uniref:Integral membrane protein PTH11 n=1 Tax=Fusarium heterosporum TaxID=42747 RepID=A0A8H5WNX5_FUSHE|nr:integral membrane protein PTH11 [Fusarium heterosporum]
MLMFLVQATCLIGQVQSSTCGLDVECLCSDIKLQADVKACVQNVHWLTVFLLLVLATLNATSIACSYPVRDRHRQFDVLSIVLCSVTGIVVILRLFEKIRFEHKFRPEDYLVAFCFALTLTNTITCTIGLSGNGLGRDTWTITPVQLTTYLQYLYIGQTIYATEVFVTKICVALFYLRIFPSVGVQRLLWGTIAFSVLCTIVFDILAIAQCRPISFFWQGWDKLHEGKCIGVNPLGWAIAAVSIIMDFWMLAIPLLQLFKLQMKWQRKVAVALMFLVGTFVTVVSVIRLRYLITFGNSSNPTWDSFETIYWTSIETNVGIWS